MADDTVGMANEWVTSLTELLFPLLTVVFIVIFVSLILGWFTSINRRIVDDEDETDDDEEEEEPEPKRTGNTKQITNEEFGSEEMRNETGVNRKLILGAILVIAVIGVLKYVNVI